MENNKEQKVVIQLSNNDTFIHKSLIRQISSLMEELDGVDIEVVTHSFGIDLLLKTSPFIKNIAALKEKGVDFLVCEKTLAQDEKCRELLSEAARPVPGGLAHIIRRQSEGWSYIKAGY
jgi:intracellular sulfur oxidation DsrE/DsrF family protein